MEKVNGGTFPKCVKSLLIESAYNELANLRRIDPEKLRNIESFLDKKKELISNLNCCYADHYKTLDVFEFLPGHKDLILAIPSLIQGMNTDSNRRSKKTLSDDELKKKLIENLLNYAENISLSIPIGILSDVNIVEFRRDINEDDFVCNCRFICPLCSKVFKLQYKTYWRSSNVTTHFKDHKTLENTNNTAEPQHD